MLSFDEVVRYHRKMWSWIAEETRKREECVEKYEYFSKHGINLSSIPYECYCCQYDIQMRTVKGEYTSACKYCPLEWPDKGNRGLASCTVSTTTGLYVKWLNAVRAVDWKTAAKYAELIANVPEKCHRKG